MTQTKTQTILPPISRQNYPLMNAKSAPTTPRSTQRYSGKSSPRGDLNQTTQRSTFKKKTASPRMSTRLPPASRTTIALNPDFNEYTDPTELTLVSRELKLQIAKAKKELIPYKEEVRRLQYFYNPHMFDPEIQGMNEKKAGLQKEKTEIDDEMNLNRRACQGSIFSSNELQNETLKQDYHEKCIILERIESRLDKKKEKLDQILNSQTAEDIVDSNSQIKKLTNRLKELKEEGDSLYVQKLKKLSTVGSTQTTESQALKPYEKKLTEEKHNVSKKQKELRLMRDQHRKKVNELKSAIEQQSITLKRIEQRDNWRETLKVYQSNIDDYENDDDDEEYDDLQNEEEDEKEDLQNDEEENLDENENEVRPPKSQSARSPRRNKLNVISDISKTLANKNENGEEEEEEAEMDEDENDSNNKRSPATTAPIASKKNNEDGENGSPLSNLISQNLSSLQDNEQQKGLTQPPPS